MFEDFVCRVVDSQYDSLLGFGRGIKLVRMFSSQSFGGFPSKPDGSTYRGNCLVLAFTYYVLSTSIFELVELVEQFALYF